MKTTQYTVVLISTATARARIVKDVGTVALDATAIIRRSPATFRPLPLMSLKGSFDLQACQSVPFFMSHALKEDNCVMSGKAAMVMRLLNFAMIR
jgi:hypothetical protein